MTIFDEYLHDVGPECLEHDIRFSLVGRRDRLPPSVRHQAQVLEESTSDGHALDLRLAIDYSAREAIWRAADRLIASGHRSREEFDWCCPQWFGTARGHARRGPPRSHGR